MTTEKQQKESPQNSWRSWLFWELLDVLLFVGWFSIRKKLDELTWQFFSERRRDRSSSATDVGSSEIASDS
jgi:hypothetical protein